MSYPKLQTVVFIEVIKEKNNLKSEVSVIFTGGHTGLAVAFKRPK